MFADAEDWLSGMRCVYSHERGNELFAHIGMCMHIFISIEKSRHASVYMCARADIAVDALRHQIDYFRRWDLKFSSCRANNARRRITSREAATAKYTHANLKIGSENPAKGRCNFAYRIPTKNSWILRRGKKKKGRVAISLIPSRALHFANAFRKEKGRKTNSPSFINEVLSTLWKNSGEKKNSVMRRKCIHIWCRNIRRWKHEN